MDRIVGGILVLVLGLSLAAAQNDSQDKPATPAEQYQEFQDAGQGLGRENVGRWYKLRYKIALRFLELAEKNPKEKLIQEAEKHKHPANPVLTPGPKDWDAFNVLHCAVVRDEQGYKMYYTGEPAPPGYAFRSIGVARSRDGIRWERYAGNPVIAPSRNIKSDEFDNVHCHLPTVLYRPNRKPRYQMWYSGYQNNGGNRIGYAHSDDGLKWVRSPKPVLGYGKPGEFDDSGLRCPDVIVHPQTGDYWMYYYGTRSGEHYGPTGLAVSKDGAHWERRGKLSPDESRLLDGAVVYDPAAKLFHMWHDKGPAITYAVSRDGIRWQDLDGPPLIQPGKRPYDRGYCQAASVLYDATSQSYFVYYNGSDRNDDKERVTINLAVFPAAELAKLRLLPAKSPPSR